MTDPAMTSRAVRGARLVGWPTKEVEVRGEPCSAMMHPFSERWSMAEAILSGDAAALLFSALLDWCAERGYAVSVERDPGLGDYYTARIRIDRHWTRSDHPTKLGALLLALDAAGVLLEGE